MSRFTITIADQSEAVMTDAARQCDAGAPVRQSIFARQCQPAAPSARQCQTMVPAARQCGPFGPAARQCAPATTARQCSVAPAAPARGHDLAPLA